MMVMKEIKAMMALLEENGVRVCGTASEFYGSKTENEGIWVAADYTPELFDYWSEEWGNMFGVEPKLNGIVEDNGWYFEWYDPGTMMVWKNF
jgi:hypothetical protein